MSTETEHSIRPHVSPTLPIKLFGKKHPKVNWAQRIITAFSYLWIDMFIISNVCVQVCMCVWADPQHGSPSIYPIPPLSSLPPLRSWVLQGNIPIPHSCCPCSPAGMRTGRNTVKWNLCSTSDRKLLTSAKKVMFSSLSADWLVGWFTSRVMEKVLNGF